MQSDDDRHFTDLANLAIDRVEKAIMSVGQLMDNEAQLYSLFVAVAAGISQSAARQIHDALEKKKGRPLPDAFRSAQVHVVSQILEALGIEYRTHSDEKPEKQQEKQHEI